MSTPTLHSEQRFAIAEADWGTTITPRLTVDEYYELMDRIGMGGQCEWELIDGYIRRIDRGPNESKSTMNPRHSYAIQKLVRLAALFDGHGCFLRVQTDLAVDDRNAPVPDGSIVIGAEEDFLDRHPGPADTLCIIEVVDSSLKFDLGEKLRRYAAAGERMYVVLNVRERSAAVFTEPAGDAYATRRDLAADNTLALPTAEGPPVEVRVADLLPGG